MFEVVLIFLRKQGESFDEFRTIVKTDCFDLARQCCIALREQGEKPVLYQPWPHRAVYGKEI